MEFTSPEEVAVCNLASISLPAFVKIDSVGVDGSEEVVSFDYGRLMQTARLVTRNLNRVIDVTYYPIPQARASNMRHRPIGIGVQGEYKGMSEGCRDKLAADLEAFSMSWKLMTFEQQQQAMLR